MLALAEMRQKITVVPHLLSWFSRTFSGAPKIE
jgi:hypothetical protein